MALSQIARWFVHLRLVAGAIVQEIIDVAAVVNALRVAIPPNTPTDDKV